MRFRILTTIFLKEMKDTLRDRRTLIFMLAVPILAIPALMMFISQLMMSQITKEMERTSVIAVQGEEYLPAEFRDLLFQSGAVEIKDESEFETDDLTEEVLNGSIDALVVIPEAFDRAIEIESPTDIEIFYDEAEMRSGFAVNRIDSIFDSYRDQTISSRLDKYGLKSDVIEPFEVHSYNVAPMQKVAGEKLGAMLPYLIIIMCFMGAMYPAIDLAAGEKERGTLETLLVSPATRGEFVIGKYALILMTAIVAAFLGLGSLYFSMNYMVEDMFSKLGQMLALELDFSMMLLILMIVLPMAGIFAAVLLSVSIFARSFKEAQSYITVLNMFIILPAFVSFLPGVEMDYTMALIPVVSASIIIKDAISGTVEWQYVIVAFVWTNILAGITLLFARKWFERESVLFRM